MEEDGRIRTKHIDKSGAREKMTALNTQYVFNWKHIRFTYATQLPSDLPYTFSVYTDDDDDYGVAKDSDEGTTKFFVVKN